jgi:bifunctional DNase/RNase
MMWFGDRQLGNDFRDLFGEWPPDSDHEPGHQGDDSSPEPENRVRRALNVKECKVVNVYEVSYDSDNPEFQPIKTTFVLLRDSLGRELKIFVLQDVAYAMHLALEDHAPDRPFTHDLIKTMLLRLGADVDRVTIDDLWQDTFYARITLSRGDEVIEVDSRPSDAIAIALRFNAPIYVADEILEATQAE